MIGYIVYGFVVNEINFKETHIVKIPDNDREFIDTGYLHVLFRNKIDAYKQLKSEIISQKEDLETKLNEIEQTLKEIENDKRTIFEIGSR